MLLNACKKFRSRNLVGVAGIVLVVIFSPSVLGEEEKRDSIPVGTVEEILFPSHADDAKRPANSILPYRDKSQSSWALAIDNDALVHSKRDQDYTYGFNFTYSGKAVTETWLSIDKPLGVLDEIFNLNSDNYNYSVEAGWFGFTPEDITLRNPEPGDRPYASLIYLSNSREQVDYARQVAWKTTLTLGILGLNWAGWFQNTLHDQINAREAKGWRNQISEGGELTARYGVARQQHLGRLFGNTEWKSTLQVSLGYLTEASWSLSLRGGKYHTPWSSFNPELASYGEKSTYITNSRAIDEHYFWGGVSLKARAYNVFLQGQFRDSPVSYHQEDINPLVVEAWLGYTVAFSTGYRISYVIRGHTSELKRGIGDRNLVWGGIILSKTFN